MVLELAGIVVGVVETYSRFRPVIGRLFVSRTVAESGRGLFWLTVTGVVPDAPGALRVMDAGGQVEKKPAELAALAMLAVMRVEPGWSAVATPF